MHLRTYAKYKLCKKFLHLQNIITEDTIRAFKVGPVGALSPFPKMVTFCKHNKCSSISQQKLRFLSHNLDDYKVHFNNDNIV